MKDNYNSFWPVYKNLESETIQISKYISFTHKQLDVYSMTIADLIIRIVIEIEDISKELYKTNGGNTNLTDENGKNRKLYFDTDCINYLNTIWHICNREIVISNPNFKFIEDDAIITPLKKANKSGDKSADWNRAYQALKHDRRNNIEKGNIKSLIRALGALYILNIYYKEISITGLKSDYLRSDNDERLGSDIFSVRVFDATKLISKNQNYYNSLSDEDKRLFDKSIIIYKYPDTAYESVLNAIDDYNSILNKKVIDEIKKQKIKIEKLTDDEITDIISDKKTEIIKKLPPVELGKLMSNSEREIILNKNQDLYK